VLWRCDDVRVWISRVRVNGGFLAGLDVTLQPGLNVVIGPRGSGKTTLLELIRHGLGIEHPDAAQAKQQKAYVSHLLGAGEVILELQDDLSSHHLVVDADGRGVPTEFGSVALAMGQNELERIASSPASRLNLIDMRAFVESPAPSIARAQELSRNLATVRQEMERLSDVVNRRSLLEADRAELAAEEKSLLQRATEETADKRERLREIESRLLRLDTRTTVNRNTARSAGEAAEAGADFAVAVESILPSDPAVDIVAAIEPRIAVARQNIAAAVGAVRNLQSALVAAESQLRAEGDALRIEAEPLRAELEASEAGLGQTTARLRNVDSELAQLAASDSSLRAAADQLAALTAERDGILDEYEQWQEGLFEARQQIAHSVSNDLHHHVVVSVEHLADSSAFRETLVRLLQGSGLQFRPLSEQIAASILPRQLLNFVETGDVEALVQATGIALDRAARVVAQLSDADAVADLATCAIEDAVDFRLRDGSTDKSVAELSTGQKCAVTLPIMLTELNRILILDQPEDHLDNAYLVQNVMRALHARDAQPAQTIVATHNANVP
jgi:ABC-type cobalamin/Fe3+-siderophores transport system ATPase subunit